MNALKMKQFGLGDSSDLLAMITSLYSEESQCWPAWEAVETVEMAVLILRQINTCQIK